MANAADLDGPDGPDGPDDFPMGDDAPENTMNTSMLDGHMAALASGANHVIPDQMLRWMWGPATGTMARQNTQLGPHRHGDAQSWARMHHQASFGKC